MLPEEAVIGRKGRLRHPRATRTGTTRKGRSPRPASLLLRREEVPGSLRCAAMTKLLQWLWTLSILGAVWATLTLNLLGLDPLPPAWHQVLWPLPTYLLVAFGCYSLGVVGYRLATFNDCEEAARELQEQIREAREDLSRRGLRF